MTDDVKFGTFPVILVEKIGRAFGETMLELRKGK